MHNTATHTPKPEMSSQGAVSRKSRKPGPKDKECDASAAVTEVVDENEGLPIDKGYAWVIVLCCLLCNVLCLGSQRAYGILFVEFLVLFKLPVGVTVLVMSFQSIVTSVAAFMTQTILLSLWSERQVMMVGGLCGAAGFTLSYFASNIYVLLLTQGLLVGISTAMILGPTFVIVNKYFHKRRSLATAVNTLGGNVGSIVMPLVTQALLTSYGLRGALLVLGALFLHVVVFASLLRPLDQYKTRRRRKRGAPQHEEEVPLKETAFSERVQHEPPLTNGSAELNASLEIIIENDFDDLFGKESLAVWKEEASTLFSQHKDDVADSGQNISEPLRTESKCSKCLAMFDFSLFKKPPFWIIITSCSLAQVPAGLYGMYLPAMAVDKGVTRQKAALLLTIFGGAGISARIFFGWFADLNLVPRHLLMAVLMLISCTAGMLTPLYTDFSSLAAFSSIYGLFGIVYFSLFPVVVVDLLGLRNLSKTLGFIQLFQGACLTASHPAIGNLRDLTGNYHASFYLMSTCGLLCAAILLLTPLAIRWEKKKLEKDKLTAATAAAARPVKG